MEIPTCWRQKNRLRCNPERYIHTSNDIGKTCDVFLVGLDHRSEALKIGEVNRDAAVVVIFQTRVF